MTIKANDETTTFAHPLPRELMERMRYYTKTEPAVAQKMDHAFTCLTIDGNLATGEAGDYLMVDSEGYPYPCAARVFEATHTPMERGYPPAKPMEETSSS